MIILNQIHHPFHLHAVKLWCSFEAYPVQADVCNHLAILAGISKSFWWSSFNSLAFLLKVAKSVPVKLLNFAAFFPYTTLNVAVGQVKNILFIDHHSKLSDAILIKSILIIKALIKFKCSTSNGNVIWSHFNVIYESIFRVTDIFMQIFHVTFKKLFACVKQTVRLKIRCILMHNCMTQFSQFVPFFSIPAKAMDF